MLVKPHRFFAAALRQGFALGAFNASNLEGVQAVVTAAKNKAAPVIVQTSETAIAYAGLSTLSGIVRTVAESVDVPVILHLDHGQSLVQVQACIEAGYTSVMIDASKQRLEENIAATKAVVDYAHDRGVWVEAELGAIMGKEGIVALHGGHTPDDMLTDPTQAQRFVAETGLDALAVSVGTIHGAFSGQEYIRFELLQTIAAAVPQTPLVLHGASGIADSALQEALRHRVCKINIDTELRVAFMQAVRSTLPSDSGVVDPRVVLGAAREALTTVAAAKIELFGSSGAAAVH